MLVENKTSQTRIIGSILLLPSINKVDMDVWDEMCKSGKWKKPIAGLVKDGKLVVHDPRAKVTIAMVEKTYDVKVLNEWRETAKGALKGAITKQLEALDLEKDL